MNRSGTCRRVLLAVLLFFPGLTLMAQQPELTEEFVYSVLAFDGQDYGGTFVPPASDEIFLIADVDNFIRPRKTFVYYWPITREWRTESSNLDIALDGTLEIDRRGRTIATLSLELYTFFNLVGEYDQNWQVAIGEEAQAAWEELEELERRTWEGVQDYYRASQEYEETFYRLTAELTRQRERGEDSTELMEQIRSLVEPQPPESLIEQRFNTPPVMPREAFVVNLPVGEYRVRLRAADGRIVDGSEKTLTVFSARRTGQVGVEVIPADRWTRPRMSKTEDSVIYVNGDAELYLRPMYQQEFTDLYHARMKDNQASGNAEVVSWFSTGQIGGAIVESEDSRGNRQVIDEGAYIVEQLEGAQLGYRIVTVESDSEGESVGEIRAFRLPSDPGLARYAVTIADVSGRVGEATSRQVRVVTPPAWPTWILGLVPVFVWAAVVFARKRRINMDSQQ